MSTQNQPQYNTVAGIPVITVAAVVPVDQLATYMGELGKGIATAFAGTGYQPQVVNQVVDLPVRPAAQPKALQPQATNRVSVDVYGPDGRKHGFVYAGTPSYDDLADTEHYVLYRRPNGTLVLVHPRVDAKPDWNKVVAINAAD